tara:strand:- start:1766 stop:1987 length:222 start_codon:yes stop_codon:yes gene_type:complete
MNYCPFILKEKTMEDIKNLLIVAYWSCFGMSILTAVFSLSAFQDGVEAFCDLLKKALTIALIGLIPLIAYLLV